MAALEESLASQHEPLPVARALCAQYASVFWRLARLRRLEAIALAVSEVGRIAGSLAADSRGNHVTIKDLSAATEDECRDLRFELKWLIEPMGDLSRYETMLFAQLVRLTDMLDPYRLDSASQPTLPPTTTDNGGSRA